MHYRSESDAHHKLNINYDRFTGHFLHLPDRIKDLIEIASYIFAADRIAFRGSYEAVEYQRWSREINIAIRVRDKDFWNTLKVQEKLSKALVFMTGDLNWNFHFDGGITSQMDSLFDEGDNSLADICKDPHIVLFSGGADSLAGVLELLNTTKNPIMLLSHQSSNQAMNTQRSLFTALERKYPQRLHHFQFACNIKGGRPAEESQRTRAFLFCTIAYAMAYSTKKNAFFVFENGITSINLHRREDLMNARASRTTHPTTIKLLKEFFSLFNEDPCNIQLPYLTSTKGDIFKKIKEISPELITSTVSCTQSFDKGQSTHCGRCFQCIDRRLGIYSANLQYLEQPGLYHFDIASEAMDQRTKTVAIDYVRQALEFYNSNPDLFIEKYASDLCDLVDDYPIGKTEADKIQSIWSLFHRHSAGIQQALKNIRQEHDDPFSSHPVVDSLLSIVGNREYLKPDSLRFFESISLVLPAIGEMFAMNKPKNENDLNSKIGALLRTHDERFRSEYPSLSFACAKVVPDHELISANILVEAKYIRSNTSPSVATEGIAADLTKYPSDKLILFVVYDPEHRIHSDGVFKKDIEDKGRNKVVILR
jgi:7-cyano-7-deazaguanine synthase in queuosine biosynthesis